MLTAEFKREINQNYLIFPAGPETDPDSFPVRMLLTGKVPGLLPCTLQNIDGKIKAYYDITSRQALHLVQEGRQLKKDDLLLVFDGFIHVMLSISEFLMPPDHLVLDMNYIYTDPQQKELLFCYLPGYNVPVREQFQKLTEGLLPFMDHEDSDAVMLGYAVYRHALDDTFHLEQVKEALYKSRSSASAWQAGSVRQQDAAATSPEQLQKTHPDTHKPVKEFFGQDAGNRQSASGEAEPSFRRINAGKKPPLDIFDHTTDHDVPGGRSGKETGEDPLKDMQSWRRDPDDRSVSEKPVSEGRSWLIRLLFLAAGAIILTILSILKTMGYLPGIPLEVLLGAGTAAMAAGMLADLIIRKKKGAQRLRRDLPPAHRDPPARKRQSSQTSNPAPGPASARDIEPFLSGDTSVHYQADRQPAAVPPQNQAGPAKESGQSGQEQAYTDEEGFSQTVLLTAGKANVCASFVSREPGELPTIYLSDELTIIGKMRNASDAVIELPTVSRIHARVRRRDGEYYLTDLNSRNGTTVNGHVLSGDEEWKLNDQDEVDFAQARYLFIK